MTVERTRFIDVSQLVEREREALRTFFGKEVSVDIPPAILLETLRVAEDKGFGILKPLYFPKIKFKQTDEYPGWKVKLRDWYWEKIIGGRVSNEAAKLGGYWALFDESRRPNDNESRQMFPEDPLAPMLTQARERGSIAVSDFVKHVPKGSRFAVSPNEQDRTVFPQLAQILRLNEVAARVRRPTAIELNFAGNLRYSHLGEANTWEWLDDNFGNGGWLVGGCSNFGGLYFVCLWHDDRIGNAAFRPLVVFSPKLG